MTVDRLRELDQASLFSEINKAAEDVASFLYVVLDEQVRLRLIDTLERFTERLKGSGPT